MALAYADDGQSKAKEDMRVQSIVTESIREFSQLQAYRSLFGAQWEETASLMMPSQRNTFFYGSYSFPGTKKTQLQVDATAMLANWKFAAIVDSMMTPFSSQWHVLESTNPQLQKNRQVRLYFEQVSQILANMRYAPLASFRRNNQAIYQSIGAFGNGGLFVDQLADMRGMPARGIRYKAIPVGQTFIRENHQGIVDGFCRWYRMTARQAYGEFYKDNPEGFPESLRNAMDKNSEAPFDFLHRVCPNHEYDPERKDKKGKVFASYNIYLQEKKLLREGGYRTFPMPFCRYLQGPDEAYGRGPAMDVLPSLKTLNAQKATFLKQGHKAADPILLFGDDGVVGFMNRPGAMNPGLMNQDGKRLVDILPTGEIQISEKMMEAEGAIIGEAFLTTIFSSLVENPQMTATQVVELINQKGIFLAPMAGSMAPEYLGALIEREMDIAADLMLLPPMPPILKEAQGEYKVVYTSPLFKAARAGDAAGFLRTVESALEVAGQTGDPSHLDPFQFERAWPAIGNIQNVPESWMASPEELIEKRKARAQAQQQQAQIQALPAQAAMLKAQAQVQKRGGGAFAGGAQGGQETPV